MKKIFLFTFSMLLMMVIARAQTIKTVAPTGADYATLQSAFAAINSGTLQGQIILQITGSTTETALPVLNGSGTGLSNYTSVLIYPTGVYTISTAGNWAAIDLNGADNVTIDGRINGTGTPNSLTIIGTNTGNGAAAIRFLNTAENNTIKYCNIQACSASSSMGIVTFGGSNIGNGNDNNIVEYCNLTNSGSRPYNAILSAGTSGRENTGNIIRNNNIYNFFQTGVSSNGININSASVGFTISGNSLYETEPFTATANASAYNAIRVSTTAEHSITGNYIGGSQPQCGGSPWSFVANRAVYFCAIYVYAGTTNATSISNNIIANIDYSSKEDNPWDGIFLFAGNFEVIGNTIGATTGNGSIICRTPVPVATTTISGGAVTAINLLNGGSNYSTTPPIITFTNPPAGGTAPTATATITDGIVTGFTINNGGSGYTTAPAVIFDGQSNNYSTSHGMIQNSTGTVNIIGNNLGSITIEGSDYYSHGFEAIYVRTVLATTTLTNNLIGSLSTENSIHVSSTAALSLIKQDIYGLYSASTGTTTISGNTVANLTNSYSGLNAGTRTRGIQTIAGSNLISNNTVYNISSASKQSTGGSQASVIGISQAGTTAGTTQIVEGNTVYNIKNTNPTDRSFVRGIFYTGPTSGSHNISGNFVHSLSIVSTDHTSDITGLNLVGGTFTCANNIISLGTAISRGYQINGIWDEISSSLQRNIYFNTVHIEGTVTSGTSPSAALRSSGNTATRNYRNNIFNNVRTGGGQNFAVTVTGTTGLAIGYNNYVGALSGITLNTAPDNNSVATNPNFALAGGTSAINYYPSATLTGVSGTGITTDYYGITRGATPKMGALEINQNVWQGGNSTDFNTASNWANNAVPTSGADIFFATSPANDCMLDADRTIGSITNGSSKNLVVNGKTLTVNGSLNFTSSGKINTSTASSVVKFAGSAEQTIPAAAFLNSSVSGLETANSFGVALNGNLTISAGLTLASGTLTVGANTLSISGNSIGRTSGTIDASHSSAAIVFENTSAITLPASVFAGDIRQLTFNTSSGITAGSDLAVTGNINLNAANPTATKGLLDMGNFVLEMKNAATTSGTGDVTGRIIRNGISPETTYTFGNTNTTLRFYNAASENMPTQIKFIVQIGNTHSTKTNAVKRYYQIVRAGGSSPTRFSLQLHYLDSELNGNTESNLVYWDHHVTYNGISPHEHGKTELNTSENWVSLSGHGIQYLVLNEYSGELAWDPAHPELASNSKIWMISGKESTSDYLWLGAAGNGWDVESNWNGGRVPTLTSDVIIPANTPSPAKLSDGVTRQVKSITIQPGGQMLGGTNSTLEVFGALEVNNGTVSWENAGSFEAGTSTVVFTNTNASIAGNTVFYNLSVPNSTSSLLLMNGSRTYVSGAFSKHSSAIFDAIFDGPTTFGYSGGDQQVFLPADNEYYHLELSGSGTKTMPGTAMSILGDFTVAGTASATASNSLNIDGNVSIGSGTALGTGTYSHEIKGNLTCNGTLTPGSGSLITMNGSSAQSIQGDAATIALGGLTVSNTSGVTLYNHATTAALNISTGTFTVNAGKSVSASGTTTLGSAQCLVLKSDENGTASFIDNGTISGSGTARIERYLTPYDEVSDLKFHFISSPVGVAQAIENEFIDLDSPEITDFYKWDEPGNIWVNFRSDAYNVRNEDFGDDFKFVPGKGYLVAYPSAVTKYFTGAPYTNASGLTVNCTNTNNGGWNLIGNPFPSSINWNSLTKSNVDATLYYYDNSVPGYKYYNTTSGGIGGATQYVAPMQGFMVHAASAGSVVISNTARTHEGQNVFYKNEPLTTNILDLKVEGNDKTDYARVCFYEHATESFDSDFDAYKLFNYSGGNPELYTLATGETPLAINTEPLSKLKGSVPMGFLPGAAGSFTITAENIGSFSSETLINLEDQATNTLQDLTKNPVYTFSAGPGDNANRFMLHFFAPIGIDEPESAALFISGTGQEIRVMTTDASTHTFTLINLQGQEVYSKQLSGSDIYAFNVNLPAGIYIARVMNTKISKTQKLIIR
ncbi:MAG: hypothetical protein FD170_2497 [Bacteroidetes bacterium]|nr:MAG: hypothetical protein FD170_2497 [Bacteroidota bacterium]